jgi:hypothetical protein
MKNILTVLMALVILLFCAFLLYLVYVMAFPREKIAYDQTNKTLVVKGDVRVRKAGDTGPWQKMSTSTVLEKGDCVETSENSSADIVIGGNADKSVKVAGRSYVEFESVNPAVINCSRGKILIAIKKLEPKSSFTVKTPAAISGAQGTAWMEEADSVKTRICVFENSVYARRLDANGKPEFKRYTIGQDTQRILTKGKPVSAVQQIGEADAEYWKHWRNNVEYLRNGKLLVNNFNKRENFNNIDGEFGSWNIFYSDPNQHCKDEFVDTPRLGDTGYSLKLDYDVDSPYSAYNGFFTNLMNVDVSEYKYLVLSVRGDSAAGFAEKINLELKNQRQIGRFTIQGVTEEWKRFVVPLSGFAGITSFKDMKELVIVFSDLNATKKTGVVYIDDIYFAKEEPAS